MYPLRNKHAFVIHKTVKNTITAANNVFFFTVISFNHYIIGLMSNSVPDEREIDENH